MMDAVYFVYYCLKDDTYYMFSIFCLNKLYF